MSEILYNSLDKYYKNTNNSVKLVSYLKHDKVSLRIIDWFVTNFSKKNDTIYNLYKNKEDNITLDETNYICETINVFHSYKAQLKSYSKKNFDPFCRRERIIYEYNDNEDKIETTIGQLNFFKWAISNHLIEYIKNNHSQIEDDMNKSINELKKNKKDNNKRKKRQELSLSASRGLNKHHGKIIITFD